ncbi:MAG: Rpn family recombination-promoting nuclease/putative transposase [Planctomycetota bacterium]
MELIRTHDGLFKFVFGEPEHLADLLRAVLPPAVAAAFDWTTLRPVPGSFVDEDLRKRHTDLLFEVDAGGVPTLVYFVSDHKSKDDPLTAWQIHGYVVRALDRWRRDHPEAKSLPPVLAFVLYHGEKPWRSPQDLGELFDIGSLPAAAAEFLAPLQPRLRFLLLDLASIDEDRIEAMRLSAATDLTLRFLQFLRGAAPEAAADLILGWQRLINQLLGDPRGSRVLFALFSWYLAGAKTGPETLRTVMTKIHEENPPMRSLLDMLLEEGEERGVQKGSRRTLQTVLEARFGGIPVHLQQRVEAADANALQRWVLRALTAPNIDSVFADD